MKNLILIISFTFSCIFIQNGNAQDRKISSSDSLYFEFSNTVYGAFYLTPYISTSHATFTTLKIDIDELGKINSINFSDSADSIFVKAWLSKLKWHDDKATLEKYAKAKSYKDISLLIPVSFEPNSPDVKPHFNYEYMESLLKFNKKPFTGKAVILSPMFIPVSSEHNE